ncbi:caspase family protein [Streptomyces paludis]|uniref:Caspase family protein n=1 Tax=Streptomyces paludis TaxID=2282738 RepID=A0A345HLF6_9ACTN|nr:caspase family protein [Streptomyces paludis]AXG77530.1 caspase family protein [Streptomyces paludis]
MRLADPPRSKAILIGSARYTDPALEDIPAVAANVEDLAAILTDPGLGGFLPENVHPMVDPEFRNAGREIARWCREAEDVLVVYFAGHGLIDAGDSALLLAMSDTDSELQEYSSLPAAQVRRAIANSPAGIRIFIIDCCYSARALGHAMADEGSQLLAQIDVQGTYTLASAPRNLAALFIPGERHTVFSGELITLLREGVSGTGPLLALSAVHPQLHRRLRQRNRPLPKVVHSDSVGEFALVRNAGYRREATAVPVTAAPVTPAPVTAAPVTAAPVTAAPVTAAPVTAAPVTVAPVTAVPVTAVPVTAVPVTAVPVTVQPLHTPEEAEALVRRLTANLAPLVPNQRSEPTLEHTQALMRLASAALDQSWPVLARLRFIWLLSAWHQDEWAAAALAGMNSLYDPKLPASVRSFVQSLNDDDAWSRRTEDTWSIEGLVPRHQGADDDFDPTELWGTVMAMLMATAGLPVLVRVQALNELAELGHADQAVRIAQGMLRERDADPGLTAAVEAFLS